MLNSDNLDTLNVSQRMALGTAPTLMRGVMTTLTL